MMERNSKLISDRFKFRVITYDHRNITAEFTFFLTYQQIVQTMRCPAYQNRNSFYLVRIVNCPGEAQAVGKTLKTGFEMFRSERR